MAADPIDPYKADLANYRKRFGRNVRRLREEMSPRLSQERLALITGLHRTEIGKIERGRANPRLTTLHLVAHALDVTLDDLVDGLPVPPQRDAWGEYEPSDPAAGNGPEADRRQSRKERAKGEP
jgi:transcriptional regulator with XRE-family HTH domain